MGWRDLIVTSQPRQHAVPTPQKGSFEDFEDIGLKYKKENSLSIYRSPQNSTQQKTSSISSELPTLTPDDPIEHCGPTPPLKSGWLVVYRDRDYILCGGCDDRPHGTVHTCQWDGHMWMVILTDGRQLPLLAIRSVGLTDATGRVVSAWTVREHGYDGEGRALIVPAVSR